MTFQNEDNQPDPRIRLRKQFQSTEPSQHGKKWDELWADNFIPWDKGCPSPALVDALAERKDVLGSPLKTGGGASQRKRALVPGCGKGYDVLLLASHGYDAWGLDISPLAHKAGEEFRKEKERDAEYAAVDKSVGLGTVNFILGDFFKDDWNDGGFDVIYDYTFLCALPPAVRPRWSLRMSQLLNQGGHLICLEFPLNKEPSAGGPPHALREETYLELLKRPGEQTPYNDDGFVILDKDAKSNGHALKRLARWKPVRTHKIGEGADWLSVWSHT